jgi:VQ motif
MEKQSVQQKKANQTNKAKKKPIKVVYISNPMKVKANTADFRALVQELTGRDADPSKYAATEDAGDFMVLSPQAAASMASSSETTQAATGMEEASKIGDGALDSIDEDVSTPQLIDNYSVFSPSTMLGDLHDYGYGKI